MYGELDFYRFLVGAGGSIISKKGVGGEERGKRGKKRKGEERREKERKEEKRKENKEKENRKRPKQKREHKVHTIIRGK